MPLIVAPELSFSQYFASLHLNPLQVFHQRITARSAGPSNFGWNLDSPKEGALLDSYAVMEVDITYQLGTIAAVNDLGFDVTEIIVNQFSPIHCASQSATIAINSGSTDFTPFDYWRQMSMVQLDHREMDHKGPWIGGFGVEPDRGQHINAAGIGFGELYNTPDKKGWQRNYHEFIQLGSAFGAVANIADVNTALNSDAVGAAGAGAARFIRRLREPVGIGLFNPWKGYKVPAWCHWAHMSDVMPFVHTLSLFYSLTNFKPHLIRYLNGPINSGIRFDPLSNGGFRTGTTQLILKWYTPQAVTFDTMVLPSYRVSVEQRDLAPAGQLGALRQAINNVKLMESPDYILIYFSTRKDVPAEYNLGVQLVNTYGGPAGSGPEQIGGGAVSTFVGDNQPLITGLTVSVGLRNNIIDTNYTRRELYKILQMNAHMYPYRYQAWKQNKNMLMFTPSDLAMPSSGVAEPINISIDVTGVATATVPSGLRTGTPAAVTYRLYLIAVFNKYFCSLTPRSATFSMQGMSPNEARQRIQAGMFSQNTAKVAAGAGVRAGGGVSYTSHL